MLKFASARILAASLGEHEHLAKTSHRAVFSYEARPGFLYVRSRAISSRCNDNWDEFPAEEIAKGYLSFIGKPVFVNHVNDNHRRARGVVIDAALHEDRNPDGTPDTWAEVLMEIDAQQFPKLATAILKREIDRTSMGCDVERSVCSACGNVATTPAEYCAHIPGLKGKRIFRHTASGQRVGELVREICYGLRFFENSILVEPPADPTAHFLGVDASGLSTTASKKQAAPTGSTGPFSWDEIGERHPHVYGDPEIHGEAAQHADGYDIGEAANHLAHDRPEDPGAEGSSVHDLQFHLQHVNPRHIDFSRAEQGDGRVEQARQGYAQGGSVPPLVLVHRHGVYQVADGHHRAQAAYEHRMDSVPAYVAHSPHPTTPYSDGSKGPFHGAETAPRQRTTRSRTRAQKPDPAAAGPGWEQQKLFGKRQAEAARAHSHAARVIDAAAILPDGSLARTAYGEIKAPQDVDTLREENCPVCGDADTYDGLACQICGFISPPQQFRDPDLDMAKRMDLRKQVVDPSLIDDNGELQRVDADGTAMPGDPGEQQQDPGLVDPGQLDENGLPPSPYGDQALDGTQQDGPGMSDRDGDGMIQPDEIDPEGNVNAQQMTDPEMGGQVGPRELPYRAQDHTGDPFTAGPDMPDRPEEPDDPAELLGQDEDQGRDPQGMPVPQQPMMGQPGDGLPDLLCPSCGYGADATPPRTQNMGNPMAADDGIVAGDVCPNCRKAQLLTPGELNGGASVPPPAVPGPPRA